MIVRLCRLLQQLWRDERGAMAAAATIVSTIVIGMAALSTDLGYLYSSQLKLQSAADAAALAGAQQLNAGASTAIQTANYYSAGQGDLNPSRGFVASIATGYPQTLCAPNVGSCAGTSAPPNEIVVKLNGQSPAFFGGIFGFTSYNIAATATATSTGGKTGPLDIMIVLDTVGGSSVLALNPGLTGLSNLASLSDPAAITDLPNAPCKMNTDATFGRGLLTYVLDLVAQQCGANSNSKINMALGGMRTLLMAMQPCAPSLSSCGPIVSGNDVANPFARVGLTVFPGFDTTAHAASTDLQSGTCSMPLGTVIAPYWAPAPVYEVVPLSSDYRTSDSATSISTSSKLGLAAGAGGCGAMAVTPVMGGLFAQVSRGALYGSYYATAITAAQTALTNEGRAGSRKVIIFVSDGNATALSQAISATVTAGGSGYTAGANVTVLGGMGSAATQVQATAIVGTVNGVAGVVTGIVLSNPLGTTGYTPEALPTLSITPSDAIIVLGIPIGGHGSGATAAINLSLNPGLSQCHQGVAAAQAARAAGTTVYSVGYFASNENTLGILPLTCLTDTVLPLLSDMNACQAMTEIASDPSKFYAVPVPTGGLLSGLLTGPQCPSQNSASTINAIFAAIANDLGAPRLVPNGSS